MNKKIEMYEWAKVKILLDTGQVKYFSDDGDAKEWLQKWKVENYKWENIKDDKN